MLSILYYSLILNLYFFFTTDKKLEVIIFLVIGAILHFGTLFLFGH